MAGRHTAQPHPQPRLRRLGAVILGSTAVVGAAGAGLAGTAVAAPAADAAPAAPAAKDAAGAKDAASAATGRRIVAEARKHLGAPYVYGADGPRSFDCSGLTQYVLGKVGIELPRTAAQQQDAVAPVAKDRMRPGDLVFQGRNAHHVAIYAGDGKMITAPETGQDVKIDDLPSTYTAGRAS